MNPIVEASTTPASGSPDDILSIDMETMVLSPEQIQAAAEEIMQRRENALKSIAQEVETQFREDAMHRKVKEQEWLVAEKLNLPQSATIRENRITADKPYGLRKGNQDTESSIPPEFNIVRSKMKIAKAQLEMMQFGAGSDKNFEIRNDPASDVVNDLQNFDIVLHPDTQTPVIDPQTGQPMTISDLAAKKISEDDERARRMDETVWSNCIEMNYGQKMRQGMDDYLEYGTTVFQGPFNNRKVSKVRKNLTTSDNRSIWVSETSEQIKPDFKRVNPWLFFPDHRALSIEECERATVVNILTARDLRNLAKREDFFGDVIKALLKEEPNRNYYNCFTPQSSFYNNKNYLAGKYIVLEYHGYLGIKELDDLGITPPFENPFDVYPCEIWVCQGKIIYLGLELLENEDRLPFAVECWERDPSSLFGFGSILLYDAQRVVNMTYKMLLDNAGMSALPQVGVNSELVKATDGKPVITPGKVWEMTEFGDDIHKALQFFYPENNVQMLASVLNMAREFGNEESTIPLIQGGLTDPNIGDAGATGMSMIMVASNSILSSKARSWDDNITKPIIKGIYEWNMQYNNREDIKGDFVIDVKTSTAYLSKVLEQKDIERLCVEVQQNEELQDLIEVDELYRARLAGMKLPFDRIVRDPAKVEKIRREKAQAAQANQQNNPEWMDAQSKVMTAQARMQDAQVKEKQLQFDATVGLQEAQMEHDQKMADYTVTRPAEAQARVQQAQIQQQTQREKIAADLQQKRMQVDANVYNHDQKVKQNNFHQGMKQVNEQQKIVLKNKEVQIKQFEAIHNSRKPPKLETK